MSEEEPALPPDPALLNRQPKWFKPVFYGTIIACILFILLSLMAPLVIRSPKKTDQTTAISNLGQLYYALIAFSDEYGSFPNDETAKLVKEKFPAATNLSGTSSNALFRQLFAVQIVESEELFYAKVEGSKRPDGDMSPGHVLEKGECAFAYIANIPPDGNPALPIAFAPIIDGTKKFDPKPFDGKAVVLRLDKSVSVLNIDKNGEALIGGGNKLLDPKNGLWDGIIPDIRYPE